MGRVFSFTSRKELSSLEVKKALACFRNPSKWPEWNSVAKTMLATKAESIDEGDHLAIFQIIKGGLIETRWIVSQIREGPDFAKFRSMGKVNTEMNVQLEEVSKNLVYALHSYIARMAELRSILVVMFRG